jgi:hypothetical protein
MGWAAGMIPWEWFHIYFPLGLPASENMGTLNHLLLGLMERVMKK